MAEHTYIICNVPLKALPSTAGCGSVDSEIPLSQALLDKLETAKLDKLPDTDPLTTKTLSFTYTLHMLLF